MLDIKAAPVTEATISLDFTNQNIVLTTDTLKDKLSSNLTDKELYDVVKEYYYKILNIIFESTDKDTKRFYVDLFTNAKFIQALTQAMYTVTPDDTSKKRLNKMCYDYLFIAKDDSNEYVKGLLLSLAKTINRDKIPLLCAIPLPEDLSSMIALARYSSEKEIVNVKRLNRVLMDQPADLITEQMVVDIYQTLFDHVLPLFTGVMLDVESPSNISTNALEIYGIITLAALDIMNELPIVDIKKGLSLFDEDRTIQYSDRPIRINLESISQYDYPRILTAIDQLRNDGITISLR